MDKKKLLTDYEKCQIDILKMEGHSRLLKRSKYCIRRYFKNIGNSMVSQKRDPQKTNLKGSQQQFYITCQSKTQVGPRSLTSSHLTSSQRIHTSQIYKNEEESLLNLQHK